MKRFNENYSLDDNEMDLTRALDELREVKAKRTASEDEIDIDRFEECGYAGDLNSRINGLSCMLGDAFDSIRRLSDKQEDQADDIETVSEEVCDISDDQSRMKKAIAGLFGLQILLSLIYFCGRHSLVRDGRRLSDRMV